MKKINLKQGKYILPLILYVLLLLVGYFVINLFVREVEVEDSQLQSTEYLNSDLPEAKLKADLGSKRDNMDRTFGDIRDRSAIENIESDLDSVKKKEDYESRYNEDENAALDAQAQERAELDRLRELERQLRAQQNSVMTMSDDDFLASLTASERRDLSRWRRGASVEDEDEDEAAQKPDSIAPIVEKEVNPNAVKSLDEDSQSNLVVKKIEEKSDYFNTLSDNTPQSNLIKAIVDEEVKAVEGTRVRLRLLDDIEFGDVQLKKGSYLYCALSGFGQQRVKGKVESVLVGDELYRINLSVYDTDGLEGFYVPASAFRETFKDIASSATQGGTLMNNASNGNNAIQWANQALQNAYQQTTQAISKAIKKNRVRLKYGTQIYLVNGNQRSKNNNGGR